MRFDVLCTFFSQNIRHSSEFFGLGDGDLSYQLINCGLSIKTESKKSLIYLYYEKTPYKNVRPVL